ncbi:MAG: ABC transporter permease [Bacteroidales bacterium]|nr:ABC transporter permease [Bacteroidales bacterium]
MKLPIFIAQRYLLAKKSHNLINIVTWISIICISVATFAMIFVLSVFNGFNEVISDMIHQLSPDLNISATKGKTIDLKKFPLEKLEEINGVEYVFPTITEDVLFKNHNKQQIGQVKGVPNDYNKISRIKGTILNDTTFAVTNNGTNYGTPGAGMAYFLGINIYQPFSTIQVFVPKRGNASSFKLENSFNSSKLIVTNIFSTQQEIDERLVLAPFNWLSELTEYDELATDVEVFIKSTSQRDNETTSLKAKDQKPKTKSLNKIKKEIRSILGDDYKVQDQYEQQETLYKMMKAEKLAVYLILTFILIMATFNMIGSLSMLIIDKRKDISLLRAMGADNKLVKKIFINEGLLISVVGGIIGLLVGIAAVLIQQHFGIIRLGNGGNYIIDAYPVALEMADVILVFVTITIIGSAASFFTATKSVEKMEDISLNAR